LVVGKKFKNIRSTLLLEAATAGDDVQCTKLIEAGIPIECKDAHGSTPLLLACKNNRLSTVKVLIESKANVNATTKLKATPLIAAASYGHVNVIKLLLASGANQNLGVDGMTPLTLARRASKTEVVALLEAAGEKKKPAGEEKRGIWSGKLGATA